MSKQPLQIFERLLETSVALLGERDLQDVLNTICRAAAQLFEVDHSGLVRFSPDYTRGQVVAEYPDLGTRDTEIPVNGVLIEERLIASREPLVIADVASEPSLGALRDVFRRFDIRSILIVPVVFKDQVLGSFSLDAIGRIRVFTEDEIKLSKIFAAQVAAAIENAQLFTATKQHADQLETLRQTTLAITSQMDHNSLLRTIIQQAASLLGAKSGGIYECHFERGELTIIADYGHAEDLRGNTLRVGEGMAGRLMQSGDPFLIVNDYNQWSGHAARFAGGRPFGAVLEVALKWQERTIGILYVDDDVGRKFTAEEAGLLRLFADHAAIALINAGIAAELSERKAHLERLVASSPNGVIAIDLHGRITGFNAQAQAILKYRPEEVLGERVDMLYADPQEPQRIGQLLRTTPDGKLDNYETTIRSKAREHIPIRLAATWLYNAQGTPTGSVGYFEDLRAIKETNDRLGLLLRASNIVAQSTNLTEGLQHLAEMMATFLNTTFCAIFLLDEGQESLVAEAVYPLQRAINERERAPGIGKRIATADWPALTMLLAKGEPVILSDSDPQSQLLLATWSRQRGAIEAIRSLLAIPLRTSARAVGLLVLGDRSRWEDIPLTVERRELAAAIADQTATLIDNVRLFRETERARVQLRSFYEASNALVSSHDPEGVLQDAVERARAAADARRVSLILIDELGQVRDVKTAGPAPPGIAGMAPSDGLSMKVMRSGEPQAIEDADKQHDRIIPSPFWRAAAAALCLPVALEGQRIGVMWFHYDQPRRFATSEVEAIQLYVNQAAIAYDNAGRIKALEHMRQAAGSLAAAAGLDEMLEQILQSAQVVLQGDSAVIWSYDAIRNRFIPKSSLAAGIPPDVWEEFRREEPAWGGATYRMIEQGWIGVQDVGDAQSPLGETTRRLLAQIGVHSFQGIALSVGDEKLGVLYVNYHRRRSFNEIDRRAAQTFANHAALALKKARLLEQVSKARDAARVVAEVTVLENLDGTLRSIVEGTQSVLGCDAITVYAYDQNKDWFSLASMLGVRFPERASRLAGVPAHSIVLEMLKYDGMYIVESTAADPLFAQSRFAKDEQIASRIAIRLQVGSETVGVMFINYRLSHRFTSDELVNIDLFANQAAVAIRNAQLYEWSQKRTRALQALHEAGHMVTGSLDLDKILASIVEQAWKLNSTSGKESHFSHLALVDADKLAFIAAYPPEHLPGLQTRVGTIDLSQSKRCGITGRVVLSGQSLLIHDVTQDADYIAYKQDIRSELAVPIKIGENVVGVINIEHPERNAFVLQDQYDLEALAGYAASAIQNAHWYSEVRQQYEETQRRLQEQTLLHNVALAAASALQLDKVLQAVTRSIADALGYESVGIYLVDEATQAFTGPTYYAGLWPREVNENKDRGITGRVVRTGISALAPDVSKDPDYVSGTPHTRSEICVPLCLDHKVVGIINIESTRLNALTEHDLRLIETIAGQVVHWIENARLYTQLERTKETLAARGAVAWMGMVSSTWRHAIEGHALTIAEELYALRASLPAESRTESVEKRLAKIERVARMILDKPITPPLSSEEGVVSVPVNDLIRERLRQLQKNEPYKSVDFSFRPHMDDCVTARISPEWLRRVFDILIDNGVEAVSRSIVKQITVTTRCSSEWTTIAVNDTGHGIRPELRPQLFRQPVAKSKGEKGMGMGLLLAQTIAQTYGGDVQEELPAVGGTTILIRLPPELS
jgi:PAS domain S-box-containing protein